MKTSLFLKFFLTLALINSLSFAGPAISGIRTFTQPDGTKFEGVIKGDSSFHWIESNSEVVIYNPKDKFYYKAIIDINKGLILTNEKPAAKIDNILQSSPLTKNNINSLIKTKKIYTFYIKNQNRGTILNRIVFQATSTKTCPLSN